MKNCILVLLLIASIEGITQATTYYIDTSGMDNAGRNGSTGQEWASLSYACSRVSAPGSVIHVNAGDYTEALICNLSEGISIEGEGTASHLIMTYHATNSVRIGCILLSSTAQGTNGNQHISNLKIDGGSLAGLRGIVVYARSNVSIHDCSIANFYYNGILLSGVRTSDVLSTEPTTYAAGNEIFNNQIDNCSGYYGEGYGTIDIQGQSGLLIYNNRLSLNTRSGDSNGYLIKAVGGYNKGVKIHDNVLDRLTGTPFNFTMEFWNSKGGIEIYNNELYGGAIDIGGTFSVKGNDPYSFDVHHNKIELHDLLPGSGYIHAIVIEGGAEDVVVRSNRIKNFYIPIGMSVGQDGITLQRVHCSYNIITNIGSSTTNSGAAFLFSGNKTSSSMMYIYIDNNTLYDDNVGFSPYYAFYWFPQYGTYNHFYIRNNVVQGFSRCYAMAQVNSGGSPTLDSVFLQNNITYGNLNNNDPWLASGITLTPTHVTNQGNVKMDPSFVSASTGDFHLQASSPAIDAGLNVGLTRDYDGVAISGLPDIGAYEYKPPDPTLGLPNSVFSSQKDRAGVFPVPFTIGLDHALTFNNLHGQSQIQISSIEGKQLVSERTQQESYSLIPVGLSSGIYIYTITNDRGIQTGKLIFRK